MGWIINSLGVILLAVALLRLDSIPTIEEPNLVLRVVDSSLLDQGQSPIPDTKAIKLTDGRILSYSDINPTATGPVLIWCHDRLMSRTFSSSFWQEAATTANVRIITPDRPGWGYSTFQALSYMEWIDDLTTLLTSLNVSNIAIAGLGTGAPYVLAAALKIPERLTFIRIFNPVISPYVIEPAVSLYDSSAMSVDELSVWHSRFLKAHGHAPLLGRLLSLSVCSGIHANVTEGVRQLMLSMIPDLESEMQNAKFLAAFEATVADSVSQSCMGETWEWRVMARDGTAALDLQRMRVAVQLLGTASDEFGKAMFGGFIQERTPLASIDWAMMGGHFTPLLPGKFTGFLKQVAKNTGPLPLQKEMLIQIVTPVEKCIRPARRDDFVYVTYRASLADTLQVYDEGNHAFKLGAGKVIRGWDFGLVGACEGERRFLVLPPHFAYGSEGAGKVPPHATLLFEIDVDRVTPSA